MRRLDYIRSVSQARFENIAETSPDAIICSDSDGNVTFWNRSAERLFGYTSEEMVSHTGEVIVPDSWLRIYEAEIERLRSGLRMELADRTIELSGLRKDGTEFPAEFSLSTWKEGETTSVGAIVRDITERRQNEERLFKLASLDALTDLPHRGAWRECLQKTMDAGEQATVFLLDLDGFKEVNDTLGHSAGDAVLKQMASRLSLTCSDAKMIARLGGDEFVVLLPSSDERLARATAARLIAAVSSPYEFAGQQIEVGVSIGVALAPQHSDRAGELLSAADLALYRAKAAGKGCFELFAPALREVAVARRAFEVELKAAFEKGQFELYYQPQFSTDDGKLRGAEALIRWNHPERGLLSPASFIEVLGRKPSAPDIGNWVLRTACEQAAKWRAVQPDFRIGINLFEAQFRADRLIGDVEAALTDFDLVPDAVELEIVENILLHNDTPTLDLLRALRDMGIGLAFDDYGTGFASLSILKNYPVSRLKIDRSFIRSLCDDIENQAIVRAILYLGRSFGMQVIAEGVETEDQLDFLRQHDCAEIQGYLFGRPVTAAEFGRQFID